MTKMTDENDNLIDVPEGEEWTETPGGYCKMGIELGEEVAKDLIDHWARTNLHEASLEQYEEVLETDGLEAAIYSGVLNNIIIDALTAQIERVEAELAGNK